MKRSLNLDLLEFHVREATQELYLLQDAIQYAKDGTRREGAVGDEPLHWPLREADTQFDRNEKFPRPRGAIGWFARLLPKSFAHRFQILVRCKKI